MKPHMVRFFFLCMQIQSGKSCTFAVLNHFGGWNGRVSFIQEDGAVGQTADFKESSKVMEWCCRKVSNELVRQFQDHALVNFTHSSFFELHRFWKVLTILNEYGTAIINL